jgi:hypothetical protein
MEKFFTQIEVILSVYGDVFDPTDLTKHIQITPTKYWCKGDIIPKHGKLITLPNATPRFRKESSWEYSTGFIQTLYSDEVSDILVEKFWDKLPKLAEYMEQKGLEASIYFVVEDVDKEPPGLEFDFRFIEFAHQLKARIGVDIFK